MFTYYNFFISFEVKIYFNDKIYSVLKYKMVVLGFDLKLLHTQISNFTINSLMYIWYLMKIIDNIYNYYCMISKLRDLKIFPKFGGPMSLHTWHIWHWVGPTFEVCVCHDPSEFWQFLFPTFIFHFHSSRL
jgi:hypothetical protein